MKQGLSLRVSQHLALTPQLQQSIRLLQLSTLELSQEVEQMLDENPFLEVTQDEAVREDFGLAQADTPVSVGEREFEAAPASIADYADSTGAGSTKDEETTPLGGGDDEPNWDGDGTTELVPDDGEWGTDAKARTNNINDGEDTDATELARTQESLQSFLHRQALSLRLNETDASALRFLIESLNDDGYLEDPLDSLARSLAGDDDIEQIEDLVHHFTVALGLLQSLEPAGVGARDLGECLRLQLRAQLDDALDPPGPEEAALLALALRICAQPMDVLARRDVKTLVQRCGGTDALTREAITLIARLEPKPGRRFVDVERNIVVPDVLVVPVGKVRAGINPQFRVMLNPEVMPKLRVHDIYANVLRNHRGGGKDSASYAGLQQRLQEARWFIKNIQQRFDTILRVSTAIVDRQKSFFTHGELAMRPLVLREIADELGLHESTISRVTTAKYMATPFGTFELKYFFGSGLGTESGGNASSTAVRALIKQFISAESDKKPLSDNQISEMLKEQGIECAPRTVAKYREGLKNCPCVTKKSIVNQLQIFLPCAAGVEDLLAHEVHDLTGLMGEDLLTRRGGVMAKASWRDAMRLNLHSRLAQRVLVQLSYTEYRSEQDLYRAAADVAWEIWFTPKQSIKVEVTAQHSPLTSLNFAGLKIKDAVCDRFRDKAHGVRPDVNTQWPDVRIYAHLTTDTCSLYIDTSGEPLFKRGWREDKGEAPLKETLAAAMIAASGWADGEDDLLPLYDPCCGSGTIAIEAAQIACNIAPCSLRRFAFEKYIPFQQHVWDGIKQEAAAAVVKPEPGQKPLIYGSDVAHRMVDFAQRNAERAGVADVIEFRGGDALQRMPPTDVPGVLLLNPPYGDRIAVAGVSGAGARRSGAPNRGDRNDAPLPDYEAQSGAREQAVTEDGGEFFSQLATHWKKNFSGWTGWILTPDLKLPARCA